jgi:hypothetical protein
MEQKVKIKFNNKLILLLLFFLTSAIFTACTTASPDEAAEEEMGEMEGMEHDDEMEHDEEMGHEDEDDHDHSAERIPNEGGAAIFIISPEDGATFPHGEQIIVEVGFENFSLSETGNHWHVYVDGESWGMVMGGNTEQPLTGVDPGEHEIAVYISIESHEEYEDGDVIHIVVEE